MEQGLYDNIHIEDYHKMGGLSSTGVKLILDCPARYYYQYLTDKPKQKESEALTLGKALHKFVLEKETFFDEFFILEGNIDLRTKEGKKLYEAAEYNAHGRTILREKDFAPIHAMAESVQRNTFFNKMGKGSVEHSCFWNSGLFNTLLKARPDFYNDFLIVDLKTTESIADFPKKLYNYGYHRQAAMQLDGMKQTTGKDRMFAFFVVEKNPPYLTSIFTLDEESLQLGRKEYLDAAMIYSECMIEGNWPGYNEECQLINIPKYLQEKPEEFA